MKKHKLSRAALLASISALPLLAAPGLALAQDAALDQSTVVEEVVVTATRRAENIQDVPINIAVVGGEAIEEQGFGDLEEAVRFVPGVHIVDQGGRDGNRIVVRGLNADPLAASEGVGNTTGGTVATYLGEVPLVIDLRLKDIDRVEFLLGPQGTLYGAGTLGGAARYIPNRPKFGVSSFEVRGDAYQYGEADDLSTDFGMTFNVPLGETLAVRGSLDQLNDSGFIDYIYVVNEVGVSDPDPDFTDPDDVAANTHRVKDANTEDTLTGRLAVRWRPIEAIDANLTYYYQKSEVGARQISSRRVDTLPVRPGEYESALRVLEPNERENSMLALEATFDLGFADLTAVVAKSNYKEFGHRDQTDLLIGLEYSYEVFPSFTAFTTETGEEETIDEEFRLVSKTEGPLSWIVGTFLNEVETNYASSEFTPHYDEFAIDEFGGINPRPDALEYYSVDLTKLKEIAVYGEVTYQITEPWQVTVGARHYSYNLKTASAVDFPLYNSVFGGAPSDEVVLSFEQGGQEDDGWLYKFNTSYDLTSDIMIYGTISEGYRIGNSNGVASCPDPLPPNQIACALPNEVQYFPDKTLNYEIGAHTAWFDNRLILNGALYYVKWKDPQVASATENGLIPITINAEEAETKGVELNFQAKPNAAFEVRGSYTFNQAELTAPVPRLIPHYEPPGFQSTLVYDDGEPGDRLPGSPEHQASLFANYTHPLAGDMDLKVGYGVSYVGEILTRVGGKGGGITLPAYTIQNLQVGVEGETWTVTGYIDNLFDEYAESGARATPLSNQVVEDFDGGPVYMRSFYTSVLPPRTVGVRFTKRWGG